MTSSARAIALTLGVASWVPACAGAPTATVLARPSAPPRATPSRRAVERALDAPAPEVLRCLPPRVTELRVRGRFAGATGRFTVVQLDGVDGALAAEVERCVIVALAETRVPAFRAEIHEASRVFSRPAVTGPRDERTALEPARDARTARDAPASPAMQPTATGPRAADATVDLLPQTRVEREHAALTRCFEHERDHSPRLEGGTLEVEFTLDEQGQVTRSAHRVLREQGSRDAMTHVGVCVEGLVRALPFGPQRDPSASHRVTLSFGADERFAPTSDHADR